MWKTRLKTDYVQKW